VIRSHCSNCGSRTASRSARREGKDWFCSQSCLLEFESRAGHGRGLISVTRPKPHGLIGWFFTLARIVRWTVTAIVLGVVALLVAGAVMLGREVDKSAKSSHRAELAIAHVRRGMSMARVVRLTGQPTDRQAWRTNGIWHACWQYGNLALDKHVYEFCFRAGRVRSKSRLNP
jgi:hypothetical protein